MKHHVTSDAYLLFQAEEALHAQIAKSKSNLAPLQSSDLLDDSELLNEDRELDAELSGAFLSSKTVSISLKRIIFAGPVNLSSRAKLIAPGIVAPGTLSITSAELYFEVDEEDAEFQKLDPEVGPRSRYFQTAQSHLSRGTLTNRFRGNRPDRSGRSLFVTATSGCMMISGQLGRFRLR